MSPVKDFSLTYDEPNEEGTFSEGDVVTGSVTFSLTKETKIKNLFVKAKGEGRVSWTDGNGDPNSSYSAKRRYFKVKEFLIAENAKGKSEKPVDFL
uniref:Arrestin-like N-terminal domain-containing protein n=1 Tax=Salarias fasciatus TaxID=181472 RepID=A0A672GBU4_SALFA